MRRAFPEPGLTENRRPSRRARREPSTSSAIPTGVEVVKLIKHHDERHPGTLFV
jgi:hypothetical protein